MPVSEKQLAANRANARKSTGPRTRRGKARSSMNALRHGFWSDHAFLPGNEPTEYTAFRLGIARSLAAETALELALADRIADLAWRLNRAGEAEAEIHARTARELGPGADHHHVTQHRLARYDDPFSSVSRRESRLNRRLHRELEFYQRAHALRVQYEAAHTQCASTEAASHDTPKPDAGADTASPTPRENGLV